MGLLNLIPGGIGKAVKSVASVFTPNKEAQAQRDSEARASSMAQFAAEFNVHANRTWFDSLVDGLNRLVRPVTVAHIYAFFWIAILNQDLMLKTMQSLVLVPEMMWAIMLTVVGFYFGSRHIEKKKSMEISQKQFESAVKISELRKNNADNVTATEYIKAIADTEKPLPNRVIDEWNRRNGD